MKAIDIKEINCEEVFRVEVVVDKPIANNIDNKNISDLIAGISQNGETYIEISSLDGTNIIASPNTKYKVSLMDKIAMISSAEKNNNGFYKYITNSPL